MYFRSTCVSTAVLIKEWCLLLLVIGEDLQSAMWMVVNAWHRDDEKIWRKAQAYTRFSNIVEIDFLRLL